MRLSEMKQVESISVHTILQGEMTIPPQISELSCLEQKYVMQALITCLAPYL